MRSVRNDLVTHFMYFANEVRDFDQIPKAPKLEMDWARRLHGSLER